MKNLKTTLALLFCLSVLLISPLSSQAADATFSWLPNDPVPAGYKIYYGIESRNYTQVIEVISPSPTDGKIIKTVTGLEEGQTYYFAATAYMDSEESDYTEEIVYTVPVTPVTEVPVVSDVALEGSEDSPISGQLLADSNVDQYTVVSGPFNGTLTIEDSTGLFTYTPGPHFAGVDTFSYSASNVVGTSDTATATFTIVAVNDAPVADSATITTSEDSSYNGQLTASDVDGDTITYLIVSQPVRGTVSLTASGSFLYNPNSDVFGSDSFTFKVNDGSSDSNVATVSMSINPVNDAPVANSTSISLKEDQSYSGQLMATDIDGNILTYSVVSTPAVGNISITASGSYTYTPNANIAGSDLFTFRASDGNSDSNIATVSIAIEDVNDAPVADDATFDVDAGGSLSGQLTAIDDGNVLTYLVVSTSAKGTVSIASDGSFTYAANSAEAGSDSFTYQVTDGSLVSNTATVTILINEVQNALAYEVGELLVSSSWQHVDFTTAFINPSVIAKSTTTNDSETGVVSIQNLNSTGFDIRIQEWNYLDDVHQEEVVSFLAMERGYHQISGEVYAVADCTPLSGLNNYTPVTFTDILSTKPVVLSSIVSVNESDTVTVRIKNIENYGFSATLQEQENNDGVHGEETMCFIAWENMSGLMDDLMIDVASTGKILTQTASSISFEQPFTEIPFLMAGMQTTSGANTAVLGVAGVSLTDANMSILEEQSADSEINHIEETGGYIAIAPFNPDDDSDNDGLSNARELEINTHPGLWDTDGDAWSDGEEHDYWLSLGYDSSADIDGDGLDNLHDADSDNDGALDGIEVEKGYDPADATSYPSLGFSLETGEVLVSSEPVRVQFRKNYLQPVVIANMVSKNDSEPCVVRLSDITVDGFTVQLQEYDYLDNIHDIEMVSYMVMEKGSHILDDGTKVEAGLFTSNSTKTFETIPFAGAFDVEPVVLTSVSSMNDTETVTARIKDITLGGFTFKLQEQEANAKDHGSELVAYIAWTPGSGVTNGLRFEAGKTTDSVTHNPYNVSINQNFVELPYHFSDMQTTDGGDTSTIRISKSSVTGLEIAVEEECSRDTEIKHTKEIAGYVVILEE